MSTYYVTTPIYYVNDRPHLGHVYSTTLADIIARFRRLAGDDVFLLTGVDEHAAKVETSAAAHGLSPRAWADRNAAIFREAVHEFAITHDDFVRTSDPRHTSKVREYLSALIASDEVYSGRYEGWYDAGQEEYVPEHRAEELQFRSPFSGQPLERRVETNYFFRLSRYGPRLIDLIESDQFQIRPDARREEALARLRGGLNDVPVSRSGSGWGIPVPGDDRQTIYVWIDALFNYLSYVDSDDRRRYWPADVHIIGKDILWFHVVVWPALLLALGRALPRQVYVHSLWLRNGQKMSKSLGNVVGGEALREYVDRYSLDGLRWFLATAGPRGAGDAECSDQLFRDVYNRDLANVLGNCVSRVTNMIARYFDGRLSPCADGPDAAPLRLQAIESARRAVDAFIALRVEDACREALGIVSGIDREIERRRPFAFATDPARRGELGHILYSAAEALRIAGVLLLPVIPAAAGELLRRLGANAPAAATGFESLIRWGGLQPEVPIVHGPSLFPRVADAGRGQASE